MSYIDVLIPLICGIMLLAAPQSVFKPKGTEEEIARKKKVGRMCGVVLIGVAVLYLFIKMASGR